MKYAHHIKCPMLKMTRARITRNNEKILEMKVRDLSKRPALKIILRLPEEIFLQKLYRISTEV